MPRSAVSLFVLLVLLAASLACAGGGLIGPTSAPPTSTPRPAATDAADSALFDDDFSSRRGGWATGRDDIGSAKIEAGEYVVEVFEPSWIVWGTPDLGTVSDVRVVVTASNVGPAKDASFGVICHLNGDNFYYFAIGSDGYYAIVLSKGEDEVFLSDADGWQQSAQIGLDQATYQMEVTCAADGTLELVVDGILIASVNDRTYKTGELALFAYSFEATPVEVHFDEFAVTALTPAP